MAVVNDGVRFLLELCVLASLGYWGFTTADGLMRWALGIGTPLLAAVTWAVFVSPRASVAIGDPARLMLELLIFGAGVAAVAAAGRPQLAVAFGIVVAVHLGLTFPLDQR